MIPYPQEDEANAYYMGYIKRITTTNILELLEEQLQTLADLVHDLAEEPLLQRPAPEEWNVKEVLGHLCDCERIFGYRALAFARNDQTPLAGFEPLDYIATGNFSIRTLGSLIEEFTYLRQANIALFKTFTAEQLEYRGTASGNPFTARAMIYLTAGHMDQHLESLKTVYGLEAK